MEPPGVTTVVDRHGAAQARWRSPRSPWPALVVLSLAFGLVQLDASIVTVALESVRAGLGGSVASAQWIVDGYTVTLAAGMLTAGALGDRGGHRRCAVAGFAVFAAASVGCALAPSVGVLVACRVVQGAGAAMLLPCTLALVTLLFPEPAARARALGVWGGLAGVGFAAGPLCGGLLTEAYGWPAIFWVNVPVCLVVGGLIRLWARESTPGEHRVDAVGAVLAAVALAALTGGIIRVGEGGSPLPAVVLLGVGVLAGIGFVVSQRRRAHPMVPPVLFTSAPFRWAVTVGFLFNFCLYGSLLAVTLVLRVGGFSPLDAGLAVLPMTAVVLVGATVSGLLTARLGPRPPMVAGFALAAAGAVVTLAGGRASSPALVIGGLALLGCCSLAMPAMTSVALAAAPEAVRGLASGVLNTARQVGGAIGVAALGAVLAATTLGARGLVPVMALVVVAYAAAVVCARRATRRDARVTPVPPRR